MSQHAKFSEETVINATRVKRCDCTNCHKI